jgi:hypothetical protein
MPCANSNSLIRFLLSVVIETQFNLLETYVLGAGKKGNEKIKKDQSDKMNNEEKQKQQRKDKRRTCVMDVRKRIRTKCEVGDMTVGG